jgi:hypothetical protein
MIDVKIRYNTICDDNHTFWRILVNGEEKTASNIIVNVPVHTTRDIVWDPFRNENVDKRHISCQAKNVIWKGDVVIIE